MWTWGFCISTAAPTDAQATTGASGTESSPESSGEDGDKSLVIAGRKSEGPEGATTPTAEAPGQALAVQSEVAAQQQAVMAALSKAKADEAAEDVPAVSQVISLLINDICHYGAELL